MPNAMMTSPLARYMSRRSNANLAMVTMASAMRCSSPCTIKPVHMRTQRAQYANMFSRWFNKDEGKNLASSPSRSAADKERDSRAGNPGKDASAQGHPSASATSSGGGGGGVHGAGQMPKKGAGQTLHVPGIRHIIAVASGKGGVGKSTVSVNLALAMSKLGAKVGILDADVYGPSQHRMMNVREKPALDEQSKTFIPRSNFGVKVMSMGMMVKEDEPAIWRGPMVMGALEQLLHQVQWGELDVLVIDLPPGTGDAQLTICQRVPLRGAVIVSTPQDIALIDARRGTNMFRKVSVPILGVVENMSYHICTNCGHEEHIFGHAGAQETAKDMGLDFLGEIPLNINIRTTSDEGRPVTVSDPESVQAQIFMGIAKKVFGKLDPLKESEEKQGTKESHGPNIIIED